MKRPLGELTVRFAPLDVVSEWSRCGQTADYLARYLAYDFADRETAANVLSTVINELVENVAKFSIDKSASAEVTVRQFDDHLSITTRNLATAERGAALRQLTARLLSGDPQALFAERVAHPPDVGGAGIGLIVLKKDYSAGLDVRVEPDSSGADWSTVEVEVTLPNREVEQR
jgi:hypothetical protein